MIEFDDEASSSSGMEEEEEREKAVQSLSELQEIENLNIQNALRQREEI